MARPRSPQYPAIGLREAVEKVKLIWEKDHMNELPRDVVAQHMGYASLNGKSLGVLSAVGKFGLLEGRGDQIKVSELALQILAYESGDPARIEALKEASLKPVLFSEIQEKFSGGNVSDQALRSYLLTRRYIPSAVDAVIRSYRETQEFVEAESAFDDSDDPDGGEGAVMEHQHRFDSQKNHTPPLPGKLPKVTLGEDGLEISGGVITSLEQLEKVLKMLRAGRMMLEVQAEESPKQQDTKDPETALD